MNHYKYEDLLALMGVDGAHPGGMALTNEILSGVCIDKDTEVLEVGCGTGTTATYLVQNYGCKVTAVEKNPIMLQRASDRFRRDNTNVRLFKGDAEKMPFANESFDLVIAESVTVFTDIPKALSEYNRVLRPGATLIDLEMTAEVPLQPLELYDFYSVYGIKNVPTQQDWFNLLQMSGLNHISILKGGNIGYLNNPSTFNEFPELDPSPLLNPQLSGIFNRHLRLQRYYLNKIGYRVYWAQREMILNAK